MTSISGYANVSLGVIIALLIPLHGHAATAANTPTAVVRIACEDTDKGADVMVDGKFKGECPVDIMLPEGRHTFRVAKKFDDTQDRVFEQEVRLGGGASKKIDVVLSAPQMNAAARRAADAANSARYKQSEANLTKLLQTANSGDMAAKKQLAEEYTADARGCYIYNPLQNDGDNVTWTGGCRNGLTSGSGELNLFRKGALYFRYAGVLVAGREEGTGTLQFSAGEKYEGNFADAFRSGKGVQYLDNGRYEGNFDKGLRNGIGAYYWKNGERYEGSWVRGVRSGNGIHFELGGTTYEGEFQNDDRQGKGTIFFPDGDKWVGNFEAGKQKEGRLIKKDAL